MFSQVEGALSRSRGGLGIGLSLVKHLVELHGGTGRGAQCRVPDEAAPSWSRCRCRRTRQRAPWSRGETARGAASAGSLKILVVDDNEDGAESMSALLALQGHEVRMVHDGEAAVAAVAEFRPDVMLLDIGLPLLSGYEVCRRVREQPWGRQHRRSSP